MRIIGEVFVLINFLHAMVVEYIRYKIETAKRELFLDAYAKASEHLDASEYCLAYEITECEEEPGQFVVRIEWTSTGEHMNGFRKSAAFPPFFALVRDFFGAIQEMRHYQLTAVRKVK